MDNKLEAFQNLYVHFPFCEAKCHYCDFFSLPESKFKLSDRSNIYEAIIKELDFFELSNLKTLFLGGGTPSLVPRSHMESLFQKLPLTRETEVTMEANPSSVSVESAKAWKEIGIKRVSMGVQALNNERLLWLGRVHSKEEVYQALDALFESSISQVSIDYIVGVPNQSLEMIESELGDVLKRYPAISHVSAYLLTLKGSNPRFKELPSEEEQLAHLETVRSVLETFGFEQYEISNFAKPTRKALHNENYWLGGSYLGIGPSAHSFSSSQKKRWKNWASLGKYVDLVESKSHPVEWEESLSLEQQRIEYLMLRLRRPEGVSLHEYNQIFGRDLYTEKSSKIGLWEKKGYCSYDGKTLRLLSNGFFISDQILSEII